MSDQNTKIVQDEYAAFGRGDIPAVLGLLDPNIGWEAVIGADPATVPTAGLRKGVKAVGEFFQTLGQNMFVDQFEPREFMAQGDQVACVGYYKGRVPKTEASMSSSWVIVFTLRNGRIVRFRDWSDSAQLNRAYGATVTRHS
jgi:hypothetical protein